MRPLNRTRLPAALLRAATALGIAAGMLGLPQEISTAIAAPALQGADENVAIGVNKGVMLRLDRPARNVFVANPEVANVQVKSPRLIYVFGTGEGETTIYALDANDSVIYSASVQVATNIDQVQQMLKAAMPNADIGVRTLNGMVVLEGTVASPEQVEQASNLVARFVGEKTAIVNRIATATPVQVNLQVKIAEVSRDMIKEVGVNLATRDNSGGFLFNISRGRNFATIGDLDIAKLPSGDASSLFGLPAGSVSLPLDPVTGAFVNPLNPGAAYQFIAPNDGRTTLGAAGKLLGLDAAGALDALSEEGLVTILAEPNLTALSGETASFLAGGEFAIPSPQDDGRVTIEYKEYGVGLAFTPTVLSGDRISMRVRPEVSELSSAGSITVNGITVPGLVTRRAETTVELGSGQSFMIAGLLQNGTTQDVNKMPGLGDLPILGMLFKSDRFRRQETELVIVITPYLVRPTDSRNIALPTDGYQAPADWERWLLGRSFKPNPPAEQAPAAQPAASAAPGFSLN